MIPLIFAAAMLACLLGVYVAIRRGAIKLALIPDWHRGLKLLSTWERVIWTAGGGMVLYVKDAIPQAWAAVPPELSSLFPLWLKIVIGLGIFIAASLSSFVAARFVQQPRKDAQP